jgi:hypothetical protein
MHPLAFVLFLAPSPTPDAAPRCTTAEPCSADDAAYRGRDGSTALYEFELDRVDGEVLSPTGVQVPGRRATQHGSLIRVRGHFMPELVRLAEDV